MRNELRIQFHSIMVEESKAQLRLQVIAIWTGLTLSTKILFHKKSHLPLRKSSELNQRKSCKNWTITITSSRGSLKRDSPKLRPTCFSTNFKSLMTSTAPTFYWNFLSSTWLHRLTMSQRKKKVRVPTNFSNQVKKAKCFNHII